MTENNQLTSEDDEQNSQLAEIENALSKLPQELLIEYLQKTNPNLELTRTHILHQSTSSFSFSGPIPPPEMLGAYNSVHGGLANRIVKMAEAEQKHRHSLEEKGVDELADKEKRGQRFALWIVILITLLSFVLIMEGHYIIGSIFGGATVISLAGLFLGVFKSSKNTSDEDKP